MYTYSLKLYGPARSWAGLVVVVVLLSLPFSQVSHVRCRRKSAAVRLVVAVGGCRPRWLGVALVLLGVLVVVLLGVVFNS